MSLSRDPAKLYGSDEKASTGVRGNKDYGATFDSVAVRERRLVLLGVKGRQGSGQSLLLKAKER